MTFVENLTCSLIVGIYGGCAIWNDACIQHDAFSTCKVSMADVIEIYSASAVESTTMDLFLDAHEISVLFYIMTDPNVDLGSNMSPAKLE